MDGRDYFQRYLPGDVCFGCGESNLQGLRIKSYWQDGESVCVWQPSLHHQGWPGVLCGGIIATLIDCHCVGTAIATALRMEGRALGSWPHYRFATGSLSVRYLLPTPVDHPIVLVAGVTEIHKQRKFMLRCDVSADGVKTAEGDVIAVLVYRSDKPTEERVTLG